MNPPPKKKMIEKRRQLCPSVLRPDFGVATSRYVFCSCFFQQFLGCVGKRRAVVGSHDNDEWNQHCNCAQGASSVENLSQNLSGTSMERRYASQFLEIKLSWRKHDLAIMKVLYFGISSGGFVTFAAGFKDLPKKLAFPLDFFHATQQRNFLSRPKKEKRFGNSARNPFIPQKKEHRTDWLRITPPSRTASSTARGWGAERKILPRSGGCVRGGNQVPQLGALSHQLFWLGGFP